MNKFEKIAFLVFLIATTLFLTSTIFELIYDIIYIYDLSYITSAEKAWDWRLTYGYFALLLIVGLYAFIKHTVIVFIKYNFFN